MKRPPTSSTSLSREQYVSDAIYQQELTRVFARQWLLAGHMSLVQSPGDYHVRQVGPESLIIMRDQDRRVRAFFNVCRHRGFRLCAPDSRGNASRLTCPYHAWTYRCDGSLLAAPGATNGTDFDFEDWGLHEAWCEVAYGFVFVCLDREPPAPLLESMSLPGDATAINLVQPENMRLAHSETYIINANWKSVIENDSECHHCAVAHPALSAACNVPAFYADGRNGEHFPLRPGAKTFSIDGDWLCTRRLGAELPERFSAGFLMLPLFSGPVFFADHCVCFETTPLTVDRTQMICEWYVHADAVEGKHYERNRLIELFHVTNLEDVALMERNYAGVRSARYVPGPLSATREDLVIVAHDIYRKMMAQ